jgi:hypothetical protein
MAMHRFAHMLLAAGWLLWGTSWVNHPVPVPSTVEDVAQMQEWRQLAGGPSWDYRQCQTALEEDRAQRPALILHVGETIGLTVPRQWRCLPIGQSPARIVHP